MDIRLPKPQIILGESDMLLEISSGHQIDMHHALFPHIKNTACRTLTLTQPCPLGCTAIFAILHQVDLWSVSAREYSVLEKRIRFYNHFNFFFKFCWVRYKVPVLICIIWLIYRYQSSSNICINVISMFCLQMNKVNVCLHWKNSHFQKGKKYLNTNIGVFVKINHSSTDQCPYYWQLIKILLFNPFPNKPWFLRVCSTSLLKTLWEKEKLLATSNFSFSLSVFYPSGEFSAFFVKLENIICKLFQFGRA